VVRVCEEFKVSRATLYRMKKQLSLPLEARSVPKKRGPKTKFSDEALTDKIREAIENSPFTGEGYRKVWARLRHGGVRTSKQRVLRLMREANLLAPQRARRVLGPRNHDGTITTTAPDTMWGTDGTKAFTRREGWVTVFVGVDHCTAECVGIHAAKPGTRFEALEVIRQGVKERFGGYCENVADGLQLRHDHGSQFMSDDYQKEIRFLGIESSPAFVRSPEGNGCSERFIRTLKEQLIWVEEFEDAEDLRRKLIDFKRRYNEQWLIERLDYRTPAQARRDLIATKEAA
jgi:transposase InsO family protein